MKQKKERLRKLEVQKFIKIIKPYQIKIPKTPQNNLPPLTPLA